MTRLVDVAWVQVLNGVPETIIVGLKAMSCLGICNQFSPQGTTGKRLGAAQDEQGALGAGQSDIQAASIIEEADTAGL